MTDYTSNKDLNILQRFQFEKSIENGIGKFCVNQTI